MTSGINWSTVYNTPIGQILQDLNPQTFVQMLSQGTQTQISQYNTQIKQDQTDISAWGTLQSDANSVIADLGTLSTASTYSQLQTTSTNPAAATAVNQNAQVGSYTISVGALAQSEIDTGSNAVMTVSSPTTTLQSPSGGNLQGSFSINVGGNTGPTITIPTTGYSLDQLASAINQSSSGVTATVVQSQSNVWVLEIQAQQTGQSITYNDSASSPLYDLGIIGTSGAVTNASPAETLQSASKASISFGSTYDAARAISSTSNTFTDLIPGMTVTAQGLGSTTIQVAPNVSAMANSVQQFAKDWNQWVTDTQNLAYAGSVVESGSGSTASYSYQSNSKQVLTSPLAQDAVNLAQEVLGNTKNTQGGQYQSLGDIGLTFSGNGTITVNKQTLTQALMSNSSAVNGLFTQLDSALAVNPKGSLGVIANFAQGSGSTFGNVEADLQTQITQDKSAVSQLNQQLTNAEQQAISQYGQWVNALSKQSEQYSLLNALYNNNQSTSSGG